MRSCMFVVPSLSDGGAERVVSVLSSELAKSIERVCVLVYWNTEFDYPISHQVKVINLSGGDRHTYDQIRKTERLRKIRRVIQQERPEVVIPFLPHVCLQVGLAAMGLNCNVIQTIRNDPKSSPREKSRRLIRDFQIFLSKCTIVQNQEQMDYFPKRWRSKIHILPNPINEAFFKAEHKGSKHFSAVSVGRLIEQKNFPLLIDAFTEFVRKHPEATLSIYGDGALKSALHRQISENKMDAHIFLRGRSDNLPEVLSNASVFILSSDFEGMPNSLMEAMAAGIPAISTNCPTGPKELIGENERGLLIAKGNAHQLEDALESVFQDYKSALKKSADAKKMAASEFSCEKIAQRFLKIINEEIGNDKTA